MEILNTYIYFFAWLKRAVSPLLTPLRYALVIAFGAVVLLSFAPLISKGSFQPLVVQSGSMEPTIPAGALVFVRATKDIRVNDIVTFKNPKEPQEKFTHRVMGIENGIITTKGDANDQPDPWELGQKDIVGKATFSVPYLGYVVGFSRTPVGFVVLIIFPAIFIILSELRTIKNEIEKKYANKYKNTTLTVSLALALSVAAILASSTHAYFFAAGSSADNVITGGSWVSQIVINEFMPKPGGAIADADGEWLELYNSSGGAVDIAGWEIKDTDVDSHTISDPLVIPAGGYAVLCRNDDPTTNGGVSCDYEYSGFILANTEDEIILKNAVGDEVDRVNYTDDFSFSTGVAAALKDPSLHNNNQDNWEAATIIYGDGGYGTPGAAN